MSKKIYFIMILTGGETYTRVLLCKILISLTMMLLMASKRASIPVPSNIVHILFSVYGGQQFPHVCDVECCALCHCLHVCRGHQGDQGDPPYELGQTCCCCCCHYHWSNRYSCVLYDTVCVAAEVLKCGFCSCCCHYHCCALAMR